MLLMKMNIMMVNVYDYEDVVVLNVVGEDKENVWLRFMMMKIM